MLPAATTIVKGNTIKDKKYIESIRRRQQRNKKRNIQIKCQAL
ncbi:hypothetical protein DOY81_003030 [Sarcophaga bullata]|nr:hypothetical protein DOY81_003030 [Sarcophaga bullata]